MKNKSNISHYVDNEVFTAAIVDYVDQYKAAIATNEELPQMSNYLGESILLIATRLSFKTNFQSCNYRDDMVSEAVLSCVKYITNFDPDISRNGFAYVSQICYFAFVRRTQKELARVLHNHLGRLTDDEIIAAAKTSTQR